MIETSANVNLKQKKLFDFVMDLKCQTAVLGLVQRVAQ